MSSPSRAPRRREGTTPESLPQAWRRPRRDNKRPNKRSSDATSSLTLAFRLPPPLPLSVPMLVVKFRRVGSVPFPCLATAMRRNSPRPKQEGQGDQVREKQTNHFAHNVAATAALSGFWGSWEWEKGETGITASKTPLSLWTPMPTTPFYGASLYAEKREKHQSTNAVGRHAFSFRWALKDEGGRGGKMRDHGGRSLS